MPNASRLKSAASMSAPSVISPRLRPRLSEPPESGSKLLKL
nr:MAG TPA: hypothetical protein [Caudoviricetes sp.]